MTQKNYSKIIYYRLAGAALITTGICIGHKLHKKSIEDSLENYYKNLTKNEKN